MAENKNHPVSNEDLSGMMDFVPNDDLHRNIAEALAIIFSFGQIDGAHHKAWVLDQVVRKLTEDHYEDFVNSHNFGDLDISNPELLAQYRKIGEGDYYEGDFTEDEISLVENNYYEWDEGIAP